MTSDINICNMALGNIGAAPIVSFSDESQTARICASYYGHVRKYLLSAYPWSFNRRHVRLVPLPKGEEYEDEPVFLYAYPTEALYINGVYMKGFPEQKLHYDVRLGDDGKRRLFVGISGSLFADCRVDVEDVSVWPEVFCEAVSSTEIGRMNLLVSSQSSIWSFRKGIFLYMPFSSISGVTSFSDIVIF